MDSQHLFGTSRDTDSCLLLRAVGVTGGRISKRGVCVCGGGACCCRTAPDPVDRRHRSVWVRGWITLEIRSRCGSPGVAFGKSQVLAVGGAQSGAQRREERKSLRLCVRAQRGRTRAIASTNKALGVRPI